jgi:Spy/CpxP family protein refolding chaperone
MTGVRKFVMASSIFAMLGLIVVNMPMAAPSDTAGTPQGGFTRHGRMGSAFFGAPLISIALNHKSELNLTPDQVTNLENIRSHYQSQVTPVQQHLAGVEKEIATLTQQSPANLIEIKNKLQQSEQFRTELRYLRIEALENGRSVLTDQQKDQLKTLVQSSRRHFRAPQGQPS